MDQEIEIKIVPATKLTRVDKKAIQALCTRAYGEDVWCDYEYLNTAFHIVGFDAEKIVSHALWVDRSLSVNGAAPLLTAYVEYVATEPCLQGQGLASQLLRFLIAVIQDTVLLNAERDDDVHYQLAALAPADSSFYQRLGWELWQGELFVRENGQQIATPDDNVMIYRLASTPKISVQDTLSAEWREGELW
ncbi:MAG: GNAT family N-acetyltransferase [Candidatus Saccharibacteria bacterium]|nr:GNAT family N-acetyltransferase [Moraxellaceae bacterium]